MKHRALSALTGLMLAVTAFADLDEARRAIKENQPEKAAEAIKQLQAQKPGDPWLVYDEGVAAYASKQFEQADKIWQELAARELPGKLRDLVWMQIGNVSFRKGEPLEETDPQATMQLWEQSREAYRIYLVTYPKDKTVKHNLKVVELRLAKIHARLAQQLLKESATKPQVEQQIEKMQAALDHQRTAENLDQENQQYKQEVKQTEQQLAQKFNQKAEREEKKADSAVNNPNANQWERKRATEELRKALSDFQEAKALDPKNQEAKQGEERVQEKLAQMLARDGKEMQKDAEQTASHDTEKAIEKYEQALEKYEQALELDKDQPIAQKGEPEVKEALENLHMKRGNQQADEGEQKKKNNLTEAAEKKLDALNHFEQALEINPENQEAPPKIEGLKNELPEMLNQLGQQEQQKAGQEESKSLEKAIGHLEKAATSFQRSQEVQPENQPAQQGEQKAREDLARLRQQLAQKNQQKAQQEQAKNKQDDKQNLESFYSMLNRVKDEDKQREYEQSRRAPTEKYTPDQNRIYKNW